MCGIYGMVGADAEAVLPRMSAALVHRGPDGDGRARRGRLVLARDRMGEKPLYHATTAAGFLFASEPKALLASGHVGREPDWAALAAYLRTGYVPNPASAFAAVQKLPPGGRLVLERESARADRYWEVEIG